MKKIILILLLFAFTFPVLGQRDSTAKKPAFKNQVDLDVYLIGVETSYKRRITPSVFFGVGIGGFMVKYGGNGTLFEFLRAKALIDYQISGRIHISQGIVYSIAYTSRNDTYGYSIGIETSFFCKVWKMELGISPSIIFFRDAGNNSNKYELEGLKTSLLVIKIPLKRW